MTRDFATEAAVLQREVDTNVDAVFGLRELEESWARHLLVLEAAGNIASVMRMRVKNAAASTVDPAAASEALGHLEAAERWQWRIGSYATGSGEGLASMSEVHSLQMARAWLAAALFRQGGDTTMRALTNTLIATVERAHNGLGDRYEKSIRQLRVFLGD